ncbi:hypothetical protein PHYPSEUDO_000853 [Phytophthora pseudosyringae]|uniref:SCP domain-containing protein n=1 Tax=Phytophthora pseudosyringae TaxID=221518 RepID=A0A8T1W0E9_9STRA|nr:hypothetical protein PHYPSEUDO_000853 [Phytophthora pseudosyringae]
MSTCVQRYQRQQATFVLLGLLVTLICNATWASEIEPHTAIGKAFAQDVSEVRNANVTARNLQTYSATGFQSLLLAAVNKERAAQGLSSLCMSSKLQSSAQKHSNDMASNNFMSHTGSDGSSMAQRITAAGFVWTAIAENVAAGQKDVATVMNSWMNSPGHRKNILSSSYKSFGCGYAYSSKSTYKHYWTQDFGAGEACPTTSSFTTAPATKAPVATTKTPAVTTKTPTATTKTPAATTKTPAATTKTPAATTKTPAAASQSGSMHTQMLAAVNKQRQDAGLSALCANSKLQSAAQGHSDDMAANNFMSHTGSDGSTMSDRVTAAGYRWNSIAENVAAGQIDVEAVMTAWMNSAGHRANIMSTKVTMFGCAYAYNADSTYKHYWTQDFGKGSSESCST